MTHTKKPRKPAWHRAKDDDLFTTGQVAALIGFSNRVVTKWIDSGVLPGGHCPGSNDRRVSREALLHFVRSHNFPVPLSLQQPVVLLIGLPTDLIDSLTSLAIPAAWLTAYSPFGAGCVLTSHHLSCAVLDARSLGAGTALNLGEQILQTRPGLRLIGILAEDGLPGAIWSGTVSDPFQPAKLAALALPSTSFPNVLPGATPCPPST